ncbi:response regulator [Dyadobacter subterraneus]|uniref:Response regulator n=1 Tax=Dyadobacter subterraneus TaxID=2773304 RepID=A0ABR9WHD3_9BACT|nr:response regulator [Dyadobacter subterraneus]MBE9463761.1 response regulator [Dyadobacter subterraneus]
MSTDKKEIYIVEDSADYRQLLRMIFTKSLPDYPLRFFQGGSELYQFMILQSSETYTGRIPGLIIMDLNLPIISGTDMITLVRQTPPNKNTNWNGIPIIILSNITAQEQVNKCYQVGADSYFVKPADAQELQALLKTICHYWIDHNVLATP